MADEQNTESAGVKKGGLTFSFGTSLKKGFPGVKKAEESAPPPSSAKLAFLAESENEGAESQDPASSTSHATTTAQSSGISLVPARRKFSEGPPCKGFGNDVDEPEAKVPWPEAPADAPAQDDQPVRKRVRKKSKWGELPPGMGEAEAAAAAAAVRRHDNLMEALMPDMNSVKTYDQKAERDTYEDAIQKGGVIEGGTWEHRKRAMEMAITAQKAFDATKTRFDGGRQHLANYLPPEALQKFLANAEAVTSGAQQAQAPQAAGPQLDQSNIGFRMLQQAGWSAGQGLGAAGSGMQAPVAAIGAGTMGLGAVAPSQVEESDDVFGQYRKRMMTAYKHRPNPLNNPRRSYDGYATGFTGV